MTKILSVQELRRDIARSYEEDELLRQVIEIAHARGWLVHHCRPARTKDGRVVTPIQGDAGFPDLVLARNGRVVFAELKNERGRVTTSQRVWMSALSGLLNQGRVYACFWRPSDLAEIERVLT